MEKTTYKKQLTLEKKDANIEKERWKMNDKKHSFLSSKRTHKNILKK